VVYEHGGTIEDQCKVVFAELLLDSAGKYGQGAGRGSTSTSYSYTSPPQQVVSAINYAKTTLHSSPSQSRSTRVFSTNSSYKLYHALMERKYYNVTWLFKYKNIEKLKTSL
jgi:hypothetical protein